MPPSPPMATLCTSTKVRIKPSINWQSYNVGSHESVNYHQPNSNSITLNRVDPTAGASKIFGSITANGKVWLINPAGIWFAPGSFVSVGGLLATTANIRDQDFMSGNYHFIQPDGWNGAIVNEGTIIINNAGLGAFIGVGVSNNGTIKAEMGTVVLGASREYTIDFTGDHLVNFALGSEVSQHAVDAEGHTLTSAVSNKGAIYANGGRVQLTAKTAGEVLDHAINLSGVAEAKSVKMVNGEVVLDANEGTVEVSGKLIASGKQPGQTGGTVTVFGNAIYINNKAKIDVSGANGGGEVLIGGNAHGAGPERNASLVFVGSDTSINANALVNGNGGKVVVWSNDQTDFYGNITAQGGLSGGNGGWVETSGGRLGFYGYVDASAANGISGSLLLDPKFVIVQTGGAASLATVSAYANDPTGTDTISPVNINSVAANVTIQASSDIIVNTAIAMTSAAKTLTLDAGRSILLNADIATNNGVITLLANDSVGVNAAGQSANRSQTSTGNPAGDTETVNGNITQASSTTINSGTAATTITIGSSATSPFNPGSISLYGLTAKNISITTPNAATLNGALSSTGTVAINANTSGGSSGFTLASGSSITTTNATAAAIAIVVNSTIAGTGSVALNGGNITDANNGTITLSTTGVSTASGGNSTGGSITQTAGTLNSTTGKTNINLFVPIGNSSGISGVSGPDSNALSATPNAGTLTLTAGTGGAFVSNTGSVTLAISALATNSPLSAFSSGVLTLPSTNISTGTGNIKLESLGGALTTASNLSTTSGNILLSATTVLTIDTNFSVSSTLGGTISLLANQGGAGASKFVMNAGSLVSTTNTGSNAVLINVNTASGGTGGATLNNITAGSGGTVTVATNTGNNTTGGSITETASTALNVGTAGTINLAVPTASASAIGTSVANILTTSAGGTLNLTMGSGGAFVTNTGNLTLSTPTVTAANYQLSIFSSGALTLPVSSISTGSKALTLQSNGGTLSTNGNLSTTSGVMTLVGSTGLTIANTLTTTTGAMNLSTSTSGDLTISSAGSIVMTSGGLTASAMNNVAVNGSINAGSGIIAINANQGSGSGNFLLNSGGSLTTTNAGTSAIIINVNTSSGGTGGALFGGGNITAGSAGDITIATNNGGNTTGGSITQSGSGLVGFGANSGTIILSVPLASLTSGIGTNSNPVLVQTAAGKITTLQLITGGGGAYISSSGTGTLTLSTLSLAANAPLSLLSAGTLTTTPSISTGTSDLTLEGNSGALTINGSLTTTSGNVVLQSNGGALTIANNITTGSGNLNVSDLTSGILTINPAISIHSTSGSLTMSSAQGITLNATAGGAASINTGSGAVTINTNTSGGAGVNDFVMKTSGSNISSITTTNTSANAVKINVNASGGGTRAATLTNITTGSGGTLTVATNTGGNTTGGVITEVAGTTLNVGTGGTINLLVPTAGSAAIGTSVTNISITSADGILNLTMGSGGAFVTNTGNLTLNTPTVTSANYPLSVISSGTLTLPASNLSAGTGALTFESNGGALSTNGNVTTTSGAITLVGATGLTIANALTTGNGAINLSTTSSGDFTLSSAGSIASTSGALIASAMGNVTLNSSINEGSGTIAINANQGSGSGNFVMNTGSSIATTNASATAIAINVNTSSGGTGGAVMGGGNITAGNAGKITIATNNGGNTTGGAITQNGSGTIGFGASSGTIILSVPAISGNKIGTSSLPILIQAAATKTATLQLVTGTLGAFISSSGTGTVALSSFTSASNSPLSILSAGSLTSAPVISTGTSDLILKGNGGLLTINGSLTTTSGNITLLSNGGALTISNNMTTGSGNISISDLTSGTLTIDPNISVQSTSGSLTMNGAQAITLSASAAGGASINTGTGTITINANTNGAGVGNFTMSKSGTHFSSLATTNTGSNAININVNTSGGGAGTATLGNITTGSGGTLAVNVYAGSIAETSGASTNVGTGTVNLTTNQDAAEKIGTTALPMVMTQAGIVSAVSGSGGIFLGNSLNSNGMVLGNINTTGLLSVITTGPLSQVTPYTNLNAITISGISTSIFTAGANAITLANPNNQLNANVNANGNPFPTNVFTHDNGFAINNEISVSNSGSNNVTVVSKGILVMANSTVGAGVLSLSGTNGVEEIYGKGQLITTASGATGTILNGGTGPVMFENDIGNNFNGPVAIATTNTTTGTSGANPGATINIINNLVPIVLGTVNGTATNTGNSLLVTAQGSITQNAALTVGGSMTVNATAANTNVYLNSFTNNFSNPVAFGPFSSTNGVNSAFLQDVMIKATDTVASPTSFSGLTNLRDVLLSFTGGSTLSLPTISLTGILSLSSPAGITQTGTITAPNLVIRGAGNDVLTGNNSLTNIAANLSSGSLSMMSASTNPLTIASITDELGTVTGIVATTSVSLQATNANSDILINAGSAITAYNSGYSIVLAGPKFTNNEGADALNPVNGFFQVWSGNPANDTVGGLSYNYIQYGATYGVTTPVQSTGNGLLYSYSPPTPPVPPVPTPPSLNPIIVPYQAVVPIQNNYIGNTYNFVVDNGGSELPVQNTAGCTVWSPYITICMGDA